MRYVKLLFTGSLLIASNVIFAQGVDEAAPDFTLKNLSNQDFTLSEQQGKVVFIFFFGHGCPHCLSNGPNTQTDIYAVYKDNPNFVTVGIDTWSGSNISNVTSFKTSTGIEYELLLDGGSVATTYSTTYDRIHVIGQNGITRYISPGYATKEATADASDVISDLLALPTSIFDLRSKTGDLSTFPNPVSNLLYFNNPFGRDGNIHIELFDLSGRIVLSQQQFISINKTVELDISEIPNGFYVIKVSNGQEQRVSKFVTDK